MLKSPLRAVFAALIAFVAASPALAAPPHRFVVFGDSLSDPGNAFVLIRDVEVPPFESLIPSAPYARGALHFSNGPTWVEQLSLIDRALPSAGPALLAPKVFHNYAVGGARAGPGAGFDMPVQVALFIGDVHGLAPADALYVTFFGGNDVRDALQALATDPTGATSAGIIAAAIASYQTNLLTLHAAGARRFLVPNVPDIGLTPAVRLAGPAAQGAARALTQGFNAGLEQLLRGLELSLGVDIVRLDTFALVDQVVSNPAAFDLIDVTDACIRLNTVANAFCPNPGKFLFWDGIHPTVAGHHLLAVRADAALKADATVVATP